MSALFRKRPAGETFLLVDIENGSVASALAYLPHTAGNTLAQPELIGAERRELPVLAVRSSREIAKHIELALDDLLFNAGAVAAHFRQDPAESYIGDIRGAHLFFGAPWVASSQGETLRWVYDPELLERVRAQVTATTREQPLSAHPFGRAAARTAARYATEEPTLLVIVTGEVVDLILAQRGVVLARGTLPLGSHSLLRTLQSHAGLTTTEARSLLRLLYETDTLHAPQAHRAAAEQFVTEFADTAGPLLVHHQPSTVVFVGQEASADWFARALSEHAKAAELFPTGATVRTLRAKHLEPHVLSETRDVPLMLEALFINDLHAKGAHSI